jgi:transcription elongation factor Elf1
MISETVKNIMLEYSIENRKGTITCDECGESEDVEAMDVFQVMDYTRDLGWEIIRGCGKNKQNFEHYCINCRDR